MSEAPRIPKDALVNWLRQFARGKEGFSTPLLLAAADRIEQCPDNAGRTKEGSENGK